MLEHLRPRLASYKFGVVLNLLITPLVRSCNVQDSESKKEVIFFIKTYLKAYLINWPSNIHICHIPKMIFWGLISRLRTADLQRGLIACTVS